MPLPAPPFAIIVLLALLASFSILRSPDYQTLERPHTGSVPSKIVVPELLDSIVPRNRSGPFKPPRPSPSFLFP